MADIPEINKKNPNIISINFQNMLGAHIVTIQKIIIKIESHNINQAGRCCLVSLSAIYTII